MKVERAQVVLGAVLYAVVLYKQINDPNRLAALLRPGQHPGPYLHPQQWPSR